MSSYVQGNWNKETMIRKTLEETPASEAEWIMWVDIDTIVPDMTVTPRFEEYEGKDLVVWGDRDTLMKGNLEGVHGKWSRAPLIYISCAAAKRSGSARSDAQSTSSALRIARVRLCFLTYNSQHVASRLLDESGHLEPSCHGVVT